MKQLRWWWALVLLLLAACGGGGVGSGGTGIEGLPGSGGTGITVGAINGFGSIIVNDVRYEVDTATVRTEDGAPLKLGMTARVLGTVDFTLAQGTATEVVSEVDLRGPIERIDAAAGSFVVLGTTVTLDPGTVMEGWSTPSAVQPGETVQVYGLPGPPGQLRATRIERPTSALPVVSGVVQELNAAAGSFRIGALTVTAGNARPTVALSEGMVVRVRGSAPPVAGVLAASSIAPWYAPPRGTPAALPFSLAGLVSDYMGLHGFRVAGVPVVATGAQITGGPSSGIGNGVRLAVDGVLRNGVLEATRLRIQHVPGTGGPVSFYVSGAVGGFKSAAQFQVQGQRIDASRPGVVFIGGTLADLANGAKVAVEGSTVVDGVLLAEEVTFGAK